MIYSVIKNNNNGLFCRQIGQARFRAPEVQFRPDLIGEEYEAMHEVLLFSIQKSDTDLRKILSKYRAIR